MNAMRRVNEDDERYEKDEMRQMTSDALQSTDRDQHVSSRSAELVEVAVGPHLHPRHHHLSSMLQLVCFLASFEMNSISRCYPIERAVADPIQHLHHLVEQSDHEA